jgi:hypothetical protein
MDPMTQRCRREPGRARAGPSQVVFTSCPEVFVVSPWTMDHARFGMSRLPVSCWVRQPMSGRVARVHGENGTGGHDNRTRPDPSGVCRRLHGSYAPSGRRNSVHSHNLCHRLCGTTTREAAFLGEQVFVPLSILEMGVQNHIDIPILCYLRPWGCPLQGLKNHTSRTGFKKTEEISLIYQNDFCQKK